MFKYYETQLEAYSPISSKISQVLQTTLESVKKFWFDLKTKKKIRKNKSVPSRKNLISESSKDLFQVQFDEIEKKQFLHKLKIERKEREERIKSEMEVKARRMFEEMERARILEEQEKQRRKEEKLKKIVERQEQLELEKKNRIEEFQQSNLVLKKVASVKPLFKELEDRFVVNIELPELEQRKRELALKRQVFAPMNVKEIISHEKQYEKYKEQMSSKRKNRIAENKQEDLINSSYQNLYKSKIFEIVQQTEKEKKDLLQQRELNKKILTEKSKRYGEIVFELFKPTVSLNKSLEKVPFQQTPVKTVIKKVQVKKSVKDGEEKKVTNTTRNKSTKAGLSRIKRLSSAEQKKPEIPDYLAEQRKKRQEHSSKAIRLKNWQNVNDMNLNPDQKLEKIRSQVQLLDSQTKSYEILTTIHNDLQHSNILNQSYVEAIRAKLAYLNELATQ